MKLANGCEEFKKKIGEAIWDPEKYTELTDQVLQQIQFSDSTKPSIKEVCLYLCRVIY